MTKELSLSEALPQLEALIAQAKAGDEIILTESGKPVVRVSPVLEASMQNRKAGSAKGQVWMSDDFDAPLEDFKDYM
ncbi:MAG: type II toxin-antitoxin system prevent-host-death family antitoxin [Rhizobacter sp.]|nr:type II toxin-antitoxin system prevent-host-death family antitoxin [Chlorobiales bacterium]